MAKKLKMCAPGQWKVKFNPKPRKGMFTKLDGSMVNVPVIFHSGYMVAESLIPQLMAQVRLNSEKQKLEAQIKDKYSHTLVTGINTLMN